MENFMNELTKLINKYSKENGSDSPDYILASFLINCLTAFNTACSRRDYWNKNNTTKK